MRTRLALTGVLTGLLTLSAAMPATALLDGDGLLDPITDPLLGGLEDVVDDVVDELGTGTLDPAVVDALLATAQPDDEVHDLLGLGWSEYLPAYPDADYEPSVYNDCPPGHNQCVDQVIREMERRYDRFGCDHSAIFSLTYKLTTEEYRRAVEDPEYFQDNAFVNHQDVVFADYYFDPVEAWYRHERIEDVPPAWRIAFQSADDESVSTTGDVLLGMNAHIRRDLPFVLAAIGMVTEDGETRKDDHDRVNDFLAEVQSTITEEIQRRHDPDFGTATLPLALDEHATMHAIRLMREEAWRKAELLVDAETEADRERVAALIEADAAMSAEAMASLFRADDAEARRAHCES